MASAYDKASLVMLPHVKKDGTLYSVKPEDRSGDFTFSRGSNLAATRVGADGLIEKGRENLLTYSNQFDTGWSLSGATLTSGQTGYDGSSDAWQLTSPSSGNNLFQTNTDGGVQTYSVYAKGDGSTGVRLYAFGDANANVYFNLNDGSVVTGSSYIDAKIEPVSGATGWYRCSMTFNQTNNTTIRIYTTNNASANAAGSIYIQDAQLEIGLAATDYIESGATTGKAGLLEDEPRFDYSGGATCGSLLLEPSRTNAIPYSEYLSGLSLGNSPTLTQNYAVSPEGVQNAVRIQDTDGSNFKTIQTQFNISAGTTYTISLYVKKATSPISTYGGFYFDFDGGTRLTSNLIFDEYNGTLINASGNAITSVIHPVIDEGDYWRFSATATDTGSNTLLRATLRPGASANGTSLAPVIKDYTAYGFQCEQASYPTSYIPNHSGGSVTRGGDDITLDNMQSNGIFGSSAGTIFLDIKRAVSRDSNEIEWEWKDSANAAALRLYYRQAGECSVFTFYNNRDFEFITDNETIGYSPKIAISYDGTSRLEIFGNGTKLTKTGGNFQSNVALDVMQSISTLWNITEFNKILFFPEALSDADCIALTS